VRVADRQIEQVVRLSSVHRFFDPEFASWSGMMPDGSPVVVRDISSQEIYAVDVQWP
jgi:hypothetical protein